MKKLIAGMVAGFVLALPLSASENMIRIVHIEL